MTLLQRMFPKAHTLEQAQKRIESLEVDLADFKVRNSSLWDSYNARDSVCQKQKVEIDELRSKLREQTDADLMLVSARILIATLKGEKPAANDVAMQQSLLAQQADLRASSQYYYYGSTNGLLNSLGLGIFQH